MKRLPSDDRGTVLPIRGTLSLVLPAYNEAANLEAVVRRALEVCQRSSRTSR